MRRCFLFGGDEVFKKIKVLSGGEKSRVALANTLISDANFLLLDEPTNHLDMLSAEVLERALDNFNVTLLVISHDRYFLDKVVDTVVELAPDSGTLTEYSGGYTDYLAEKTVSGKY